MDAQQRQTITAGLFDESGPGRVTGAHTQSVRGSAGATAWMTFTVEVASSERLGQVLRLVLKVPGVRSARRR